MDVAKMGFSVDTKDLDLAVQKLNQMKPAAAGAQAAANSLSKAAQGASTAIYNAAVKTAQAEASKASAALASARASGTSTKADLAAAMAADRKARAAVSAAKADRDRAAAAIASANAQNKMAAATEMATVAMRKQDSSLNSAARLLSGGGRRGGGGGLIPANDQMPNRFNTANIAAQFQDIGVTAAMGMNPLTIALQQGTQLSAILNSMESPLKGIAQAFTSIINPVSLLSIGLVGLVAAGFQMVDWISVGQGLLNGLANVIETTTPYVLGLSAALALVYAPAIFAGFANVISLVTNLGVAALAAGAKMAAAWAMANPVTAFVLGFSVTLTAAYQFRDELAKLLGVDIFEYAKEGVNNIVGAFVGAYNGVVKTWRDLPAAIGDLVIQAASNTIVSVEKMLNTVRRSIREFAGLKADNLFDEQSGINNPFQGSASGVGASIKTEMEAAMNGVDYVGIVGNGIQQASNSAAENLRKMATSIGLSGEDKKKSGGKTEAEKYEDIVKGAQRRVESLKAEQAALGLTTREADKLRAMTDLLNDAQQKNIDLSPQQRAELGELAGTMADIQEQTRRTEEAFNLIKDTSKGLFSDLKSGLQEGKGLWQSFSDAAINALNRVMDKMMDVAFNQLFDGFGSSSVGGGFLSSVGSFLFNAKGNAFNQSGVSEFAKGGAFTNSVVNSPTMFAFGKGGSFGVMGEAGPEAVMPLSRGPDGSLGVKAVGGGSGGGNVIVNIYGSGGENSEVQQRQTSQGVEIDVFLDEMVAQKIGSQGSASDAALRERNNRQFIRR